MSLHTCLGTSWQSLYGTWEQDCSVTVRHSWDGTSLHTCLGTSWQSLYGTCLILSSFEAFEMDGKIDTEVFSHSLTTFGNKFSAGEVEDAFAEFKIDGGMIDAAHLKGLMG